jgi:hypothetical protein
MAQIKDAWHDNIHYEYIPAWTVARMQLAEDEGDRYNIYVERTSGPRNVRILLAKPKLLGYWEPVGSEIPTGSVGILDPDNEDCAIWLSAQRADGKWENINSDYDNLQIQKSPDLRSIGLIWAFQQTKVNVQAFEQKSVRGLTIREGRPEEGIATRP